MFGLCAFFAFVVTVVCDVDVAVGTPADLGLDPGRLVVEYLKTNSDGSLKGLEYEVNLENKAKKYLKCTWQPDGRELFFEDPPAECKKAHLLGSETLLYGVWDGQVDSPEGIVIDVKNYWDKKGDEGGEEALNAAIQEAESKSAKKIGCAYFYMPDMDYLSATGEQVKEAIGDLACILGQAD